MSEYSQTIAKIEGFFEQQRELYGDALYLDEKYRPQIESDNDEPVRKAIPIIEPKERRIPSAPRFKQQPGKSEQMALVKNKLNAFKPKNLFGGGSLDAKLVFVAGAVADDNIRSGKVFTQQIADLFRRMLKKISFVPNEVYMTPAIKFCCENPGQPNENEHRLSVTILKEQLQVIKPRYIFCLGEDSVRTLFESKRSIYEMRNRAHDLNGSHVIVSHHLGELLQNKQLFWDVFEDMKLFRKIYDKEYGGKPPII